ncbi:MAG: exodeoxyribonuclease III [Myxococcales bacterium]|nr:MAG: exodeoxyribonuclease III [Myxococcales bacterium]
MLIYSWNVNGIRAACKKGFLDWFQHCGADIVGLQEVRANEEQIPEELRAPAGWYRHSVSAERKGYSGVTLYSRQEPDEVHISLSAKEFDCEGRLQVARFGKLWVVNCYFPNGNGKDRDNSRVLFKLAFYQRLFDYLEPAVKKNERLVVMGDFNTAHTEIDIARPKANEKTSGFLPEEREEFSRWLGHGYTDTFRMFTSDPHHYSWWSQRAGARARNVGWRIDYVLSSDALKKEITGARIHPEIMGSDHCPISVTIAS